MGNDIEYTLLLKPQLMGAMASLQTNQPRTTCLCMCNKHFVYKSYSLTSLQGGGRGVIMEVCVLVLDSSCVSTSLECLEPRTKPNQIRNCPKLYCLTINGNLSLSLLSVPYTFTLCLCVCFQTTSSPSIVCARRL